jgi:hypothetical protein
MNKRKVLAVVVGVTIVVLGGFAGMWIAQGSRSVAFFVGIPFGICAGLVSIAIWESLL